MARVTGNTSCRCEMSDLNGSWPTSSHSSVVSSSHVPFETHHDPGSDGGRDPASIGLLGTMRFG